MTDTQLEAFLTNRMNYDVAHLIMERVKKDRFNEVLCEMGLVKHFEFRGKKEGFEFYTTHAFIILRNPVVIEDTEYEAPLIRYIKAPDWLQDPTRAKLGTYATWGSSRFSMIVKQTKTGEKNLSVRMLEKYPGSILDGFGMLAMQWRN